MNYYFLTLIALLTSSFRPADRQINDERLEYCNTAKDIGYLSVEEKAVIYYINIVRTQPKLFVHHYLKNYLDTAPMKQTAYLNSLINELNSMQAVDLLEPQFDLFEVAKKHATEMGLQGKTGHTSLSGESYESRASDLSKRYEKVMENCQYGYSDGLSIVIDLLIDEDISDVSHRKSLLHKEVKYIGSAIRKHKVYHYNCVIEMGYQLKP